MPLCIGFAPCIENRGILYLILFLAAINLIASVYNAALPAMLLSRPGGGETVLDLLDGGKGSGAVLVFLGIAFAGVLVCLIFRRDKHLWAPEDTAR